MSVQAWHRHYCVSLTTLNLSHNSLSSLVNQGLQYLRALRFLDIRHNALGSLTSVLDELGKCGKLTVLFLEVR